MNSSEITVSSNILHHGIIVSLTNYAMFVTVVQIREKLIDYQIIQVLFDTFSGFSKMSQNVTKCHEGRW